MAKVSKGKYPYGDVTVILWEISKNRRIGKTTAEGTHEKVMWWTVEVKRKSYRRIHQVPEIKSWIEAKAVFDNICARARNGEWRQ